MESSINNQPSELPDDLAAIQESIYRAANGRKGDCRALLALLTQLEVVHQDVRESLFQDSLPTNRQRLYRLLKNIEINGGWPYIQRMRLAELLQQLPPEDRPSISTPPAAPEESADG